MKLSDIPQEVFEAGIMDKEYHARLIADMEGVTSVAGIPPKMVWSRLSDYCTEKDMDWVRSLRKTDSAGLVYVGAQETPVEDKMMAITGACLRNHIDARMMVVQDVISALKEDDMPEPTVLLIPNFFIDKAGGGSIASWEVSSLLGLLLSRLSKSRKTVLYASSMTDLEKQYGHAFKQHIQSHYTKI